MDANAALDILWILVAGILVFFMQAGFALVEAGFTRAKNVGNIIMKNFMDFSFGSLLFWIIGYSIMYGGEGAFFGAFDFFYNVEGDYHNLFFQTVFAATAATIVSGAMAERTKFSTYLIYTVVITAIIYPISGHWVWGGGWLSTMETPFHDFAGSTVVHSVGGWMALAGAWTIGPRLGKYNGGTNAIPGHNMVLGALGVFILWMGWFGFNPGSQLAISGDNANAVAKIFITTNLAAAAGAVVTMFVTWFRYGKPDLSMTLNGALAGLVGITAGCDIVSPGGAAIIGALAGLLVVFSIELFDRKLKIDDPVGAISVHGVCGALGTLLVGFFATEGGLLYGGGTSLLVSQAIGILAIGAWAFGLGLILFQILKATVGLRVSEQEEREGLDIHEHGQSSYN
ncbi:ammonium transporter [Saccharicrinis fermentans]|uniref:Ammonium transporter n=1 Tax=Saccharicrinis fermentans DSM 9555 = JCM 21142 TaxID=869213 RepID=W7XUL3_9BACT|nr:ammonium transporter [Saccharicrinis fermentans]GAF01715.1 ammonia transporter [Saccharicrinis fermentans DSM 9555 = JCM 21142]